MDGRILRFFNMLISTMPPTFEQKLLGLSGIDTLDPKNIEAVLGTQFTGIFSFVSYYDKRIDDGTLGSFWDGR